MPKGLQPRRGDIFMADLARDPLTKRSGIRPVLIVQNDYGNANSGSVIAVIITSSLKKPLPTHVPLSRYHGVKKPSTALCEHIITIDKGCLLNQLGTIVHTEAEEQINAALKVSLGIRS